MLLKTKKGKVQGRRYDERVILFAGIPYAAPPVGSFRWKAPQPVKKWEGILDCTHFAQCSYQMSAEGWGEEIPSPYGREYNTHEEEVPDEDCLYLNIWTSADCLNDRQKLPVLCIIHGGGFESGSGGVPVLNGANLAKQGIVVVTINYRLGVFGFLAHPELSKESLLHTSGNYGLLDQIQALQWIQDNIEDFGGDPKQVTISGESAGSISVNALYESSLAAGLFARAAAESGAHIGQDTYCPQITLKEAEEKGIEYVQRFGAASIEELRQMSTEELFAGTWGFFPFRDGVIWPENAFADGKQNDVPLLLGSNADEGSIFSYYFESGDYAERFQSIARKRYGEDADRFLRRYPLYDKGTAIDSMSHAYGEKLFAYTIYSWAKMQAESGESDVYYYYFDRVTPGSEYGAFHSSELPYFYRNLDKSKTHWDEADQRLMEIMSSYIIQFVKNGNPNGYQGGCSGGEWKAFSEDPECVMELGDYVGMICNPSIEMFRIYERYDNKAERLRKCREKEA